MAEGRSVLLAVSPTILSDALRQILESEGVEDVVLAGGTSAGRYRCAIVTADAADADADVVIELADSGGDAIVHLDGADTVIDLREPGAFVALVHDHLPQA